MLRAAMLLGSMIRVRLQCDNGRQSIQLRAEGLRSRLGKHRPSPIALIEQRMRMSSKISSRVQEAGAGAKSSEQVT